MTVGNSWFFHACLDPSSFHIPFCVSSQHVPAKATFLTLAARQGLKLFWVLEQPSSSWMFRMPRMLELIAAFAAIRVCTWSLDLSWAILDISGMRFYLSVLIHYPLFTACHISGWLSMATTCSSLPNCVEIFRVLNG